MIPHQIFSLFLNLFRTSFSNLFLLILCFSVSAIAQNLHPKNTFVIDSWSIENGLPANNVVKVIQAENGYLWLATYNGLVRFDGLGFKIFQTEKYPDMLSNRITSIEESKDGSIWLETEQKYLIRYHNNTFTKIGVADGLKSEMVNTIKRGPKGNIWFSTSNGISFFDGQHITPYFPDLIKNGIGTITVLSNEELWFTDETNTRLYRFAEESLKLIIDSEKVGNTPFVTEDLNNRIWVAGESTIYTIDNGKPVKLFDVPQKGNDSGVLGFSPDNTPWLYTMKEGLFRLENNSWNRFDGVPEDIRINDHDHFFRRNNDFWMITGRGLWLNGELILHVPNGIYHSMFDKEGNLWLGTVSDGLIRLKRNPFKTYSTADGLPNKNVYSILEDYDHTIWVGTYGNGTVRIKNGEITSNQKVLSSSTGGLMLGLYQSADSTIYAGSIGTSLLEMQPGDKDFPFSKFEGSNYPMNIYAFYEAKNGTLWTGAENGLFYFENNIWHQITEYKGYQYLVRFFEPAPDTSLWIATDGTGILQHKSGITKTLNKESGFPSNHIRSLFIEPNSTPDNYILWVGTQDIGLIRLPIKDGIPDLELLTTYSTNNGLLDYTIHIILEDDLNNFWFNTNRGIFRIDKEQLEAFHRGEIKHLDGVSYTEKDGLLNREGNGGPQPSGIVASDGKIWMANQEGAVVFDPKELIDADNKTLPPIIIEEIITDSRTIPINNSPIRLSKKERGFRISFTALSLVAPEKNQFRYRLTGFSNVWEEAAQNRTATYTNIPHGSYTFEVIASNNTGIWNPKPASINLTIEPFYYETIWFRFAILSFVCVTAFVGIQLRFRTIKNNELKLTSLVNERTQELESEKKKTEEQAERLQELDKAKSRFFANISHELRTPLTLVMGPLQRMISQQSEFDNQTISEFQRMLRNSDRLLRLIDQTLELTRMEQGKTKLKIHEINLPDFLKDLVDLFVYVANEKDIHLSFKINSEDCTIYADYHKLDKIIANLISNAIKFTNPGGSIEVTLSNLSEYIEIKVLDTGIGISEVHIKKIFNRFYQVDSSETRNHEGSGIGLSLSYDFAKLMGGNLMCSSVKNKGSIFTLTLPKKTGYYNPDIEVRESKPDSYEINRKSPLEIENILPNYISEKADETTILIVEDNQDLREFINEILTPIFSTQTASNGLEALKLVEEQLPDLIITDIMMPKMDGITFNNKIKQNNKTASIPLIFLTAKSSQENHLLGIREGGDDYITKPFSPDLLVARVQNLIHSRMRLREFYSIGFRNSDTSSETDPFLIKVNEIISKHFSDPSFNVSELANALYLDRSHVLRTLKEKTGLTPSDYIKKYRMESALEMLKSKAGNISEISYAAGFNSLSYFSYVFKEYFKVSPSEYLSQIHNND